MVLVPVVDARGVTVIGTVRTHAWNFEINFEIICYVRERAKTLSFSEAEHASKSPSPINPVNSIE